MNSDLIKEKGRDSMLKYDSIPQLRNQRTKIEVPYDKNNPTNGSAVFVLTNSVDGFIEVVNNKYLHFDRHYYHFTPQVYNTSIFNRRIVERVTQERLAENEKVIKGTNLRSNVFIQSAGTKNLVYNLSKWNELFFKEVHRQQNYMKRVEEYFRVVAGVINSDETNKYKIKTLIVDVDSIGKEATSTVDKVNDVNNPINIIYLALRKNFGLFTQLKGINILIASQEGFFKLDPRQIDRNTYSRFKIEMQRMGRLMKDDAQLDKEIQASELLATAPNTKFNFTGEEVPDEDEEGPKKPQVDTEETLDEPVVATDKVEDYEKKAKQADSETLAKLAEEIKIQNRIKAKGTSKRDETLKAKQRELKVNGKDLDKILNVTDDVDGVIPINDVSDVVDTTNENMTKLRYVNFDKTYNEKFLEKDIMNSILQLNNAEIPAYIRDVKVEDTSDELNAKYTYTISLEDELRVRHSVTVDIPKFIDDKFLYLNGNRKVINRQFFLKPIIKIQEDTVQIVSNYNKIFIRRYGKKLSVKSEKFRKVFDPKTIKGATVKNGNNLKANANYITTIEYDELSKSYDSIKVGTLEIIFNQDTMTERLKAKGIDYKGDDLIIGFDNGRPVHLNLDTQMIDGKDIVDTIVDRCSPEIKEQFSGMGTGKKFLYSRATIMARQVPLVLLAAYCEGLTTVLRKSEVKHYFTDKRPKVTTDEGVVRFADGYLVYEKYPLENSLLMNAFEDIPTTAFDYAAFDTKETYIAIFDAMFGQRNLASAFDNFYDFMIDPITKEVLEYLDQPTEFVDVLLYANKLLADNNYSRENDMNLYRIRSNELISVYLYKALTKAYGDYRRTAYNNNPQKISIRKDAVTRDVLMAQTIEDYSVLNPIVETEKTRIVSAKGPSGLNLAQAYTMDKRGFDPSMIGIVSMTTSPDMNVGVVRTLNMEPNIISARGYMDVKEDRLDELKDVNLFSPAELASPLGSSRDDTVRSAMAVKQTKHLLQVEKMSPVLISNGSEQTIQHQLSKDFALTAKEDGLIQEINQPTGIVIVKYKSGKTEAFDMSPKTVKNGAGGFFLVNQLECHFKEGQRFKKNEVIASDKKFFSQTQDGNKSNIGTLTKVAIVGGYFNYEDSTFITEKISQKMAADIVMSKDIVIGKNANVENLVKIGDKVQVGDNLLTYENSFDDQSVNAMLANVGAELKEDIVSLGKKPITSKYTGEVVDIKIYSTVELDELSPSLRKIVKDYHASINKKKAVLDKYDKSKDPFKMGMMITDPTAPVKSEDGKVKGVTVGEGVLIEIRIKYRDVMGVGDKLAYFTALKGIVGGIIPAGYEGYSEHRPDEEVSCYISPISVMARMTPSVILTMFGNKVILELEHKLKEIYDK